VLRIECPWCGVRDETEFRYRGDASRERAGPDATLAELCDQTYTRTNPRGWHLEWWLHVGGCRKLLKVLRHTETHEIHAIGRPQDALAAPTESPAP
jgi:heterotetrameric sarcosine oxidase delta subunit